MAKSKALEKSIPVKEVSLLPAEWAKATETSLELSKNLTIKQWQVIGQKLAFMKGAIQWWFGDWLLQGRAKYGDKQTEKIASELPIAKSSLDHDKWIAKAFEFCRRRQNLSWKHHAEIASMNEEDQDRWLDKAEGNNWSIAQLRKAIREETAIEIPLPKGQYRVIYADPPWQYDNSGFAQSAASHYPTMSIEDVCALKVREISGAGSVLFLWVTSPFLPDGLEVCKAWGFEYKASFVWMKDKAPGMGWFANTKHEFLLIGIKGEGVHPRTKLDSVFYGSVTKHSKKPSIVYDMIEQMYEGPYLEMFARDTREGWDSWGNEL